MAKDDTDVLSEGAGNCIAKANPDSDGNKDHPEGAAIRRQVCTRFNDIRFFLPLVTNFERSNSISPMRTSLVTFTCYNAAAGVRISLSRSIVSADSKK